MSLRSALDTLIQTLSRAGRPLSAWLADGLSREEIRAKLAPVSISLADEVHEYFGWRNGLRLDRDADYELFPGGVLSLDAAVAEYRRALEVAHTIARQAGVEPSSLWDAHWFPLFRSAGGDYHVTHAVDGRAIGAPIEFVTLEDRSATVLAYDSLSSLIHTVTACFDTGAFMLVDGAVHEDRARAAEILHRYNPVRMGQATGGGDASVGALVRALRVLDADVRSRAAQSLISLRDPHAVALLAEALVGPDDDVRSLVATG